MLIPKAKLYDEAMRSFDAEGLPAFDRTLDAVAREAMANDRLYAAYGEADDLVLRALAHGIVLGLSVAQKLDSSVSAAQ